MDPLDGNAIGGLLHDIFGADMTTAIGTCAFCGNTAQVAETIVYRQAPGTIVRCRVCTNVLMMVSQRNEVNCVDLSGLTTIAPALSA